MKEECKSHTRGRNLGAAHGARDEESGHERVLEAGLWVFLVWIDHWWAGKRRPAVGVH